MEYRFAVKQDAAQIRAIYAPYVEKTAITFEVEVPDVTEMERRIEETLKKYPYIVAVSEGEIVGYAYASAFKERAAYDWCVETSIYVKENQKRKKIGSGLYQILEKLLSMQGILNVNACIAYTDQEDAHLDNASVDFHMRKGYSMVGKFHNCGYKFHTWYQMVWMEKMLGEHAKNQEEVKWFPQIKEEAARIIAHFSCE